MSNRINWSTLAGIAMLGSFVVAAPLLGQSPATQPTTPATTVPTTRPIQPRAIYPLADIRMRDVCILPDPTTHTYYMVGPGRRSVRVYTSADMIHWDGPQTIYDPAVDVWGDVPVVNIWAPEMHAYQGKYYLFLTFDTRTKLAEQWRGWLPRVVRGSTILVGDSPMGPFKPFQHHSTPPADMMTLDGTLWEEDGVPYMVFAHEWVQITNGTMEYVPLKPDLSEATGEPKKMFHASAAKWSETNRTQGNNVTDGPYLLKSKSGKLFCIWSSGGATGYITGVAISDTGKLAGPWRQEDTALYSADGGHGMLFKTFEGTLMMVLHSPNGREARPRLFELEDTGETLKIVQEFTGHRPASAPTLSGKQ